MHSHRQIFTHSIVFNQYTSKYRNGGFCKKIYWVIIISGSLKVLFCFPLLYFYYSWLKNNKGETNNWCFWGRGWTVREASTILLSLILCKHITLYFLCIFNLLWFICSHWSCCQAFLWPTDFSRVALPRKVLSLIRDKIENLSYLQLFFQFILTCSALQKDFLFLLSVHLRPKALLIRGSPFAPQL